MSRDDAEILWDGEEMDNFGFLLDILGYENMPVTNVLFGMVVIPKEVVEKNIIKLLKLVQERSTGRAIYFAIGYLILTTGAKMPKFLRSEILEAAKWNHEKHKWVDESFALRRKICLKDFREKLRLYKAGNKFHPISLMCSDKDLLKTVVSPQQFQNFCESGKIFEMKHVNLGGWGLRDIPEQIFELTQLKMLCLEHNELNKIPEEIGNLISLKHLYLGDNWLTELPDSIGELSLLKSLEIENNPISALPSSLKSLKNLRHIYVRGTKIENIPEFLTNARLDESNKTIYIN